LGVAYKKKGVHAFQINLTLCLGHKIFAKNQNTLFDTLCNLLILFMYFI